jgi:uncharacterized protein involved in high-affinity Fe2+ transport
MKDMRKLFGAALATGALVASMGLVACGGSSSDAAATDDAAAAEETTEEAADDSAAAAAPGADAGFTEIPIFEDEEVDFLNVSAVYFQAVPMSPAKAVLSLFPVFCPPCRSAKTSRSYTCMTPRAFPTSL